MTAGTIVRDIVRIDADRCTGCGQCVLDCAEGAIVLENGRAKVVSDSYCDGLGACLSGCPANALTIERREAVPFDEEAALRHAAARSSGEGREHQAQTPSCPGRALKEFSLSPSAAAPAAGAFPADTRRRFWPVKLRLLPPTAPFLRGADLLLAADCSAAAAVDFHALTGNRVLMLACPKFENGDDILARLSAILAAAEPASLSVLRMEVPCCRALCTLCGQALDTSGSPLRLEETVLGCDGVPRRDSLFSPAPGTALSSRSR